MESVRQHHTRLHDLRNFLQNYEPEHSVASSDWAKQMCARLSPGALVFILEPVTAALSLASFARKEEEENFRVVELCIVVRSEREKTLAINLTDTAYELRLLESLLDEKAKKAIIDRRKLYYVVAKPAVPLTSDKSKKLELLANTYAKGGLRNKYLADDVQSNDEPAIAILAACGVHLQWTSPGKQPLDLGYLCYLLFGPARRLQDSNRLQLQENFVPEKNNLTEENIEIQEAEVLSISSIESSLQEEPANSLAAALQPIIDPAIEYTKDLGSVQVESEQNFGINVQNTDSNLLGSWGEIENSSIPSLSQSLTEVMSISAKEKTEEEKVNIEEKVESHVEESTDMKQDYDAYQHLSKAITEVFDVQSDSGAQSTLEAPVTDEDRSADEPVSVEKESDAVLAENIKALETERPQETEHQQEIREKITTKLDDFQEPKLVMNEMASLMNKLELQVSRAAKKLAVKATEIEKRLVSTIDTLLNTAVQDDKDAYASFVIHSDLLAKQFESSFDSLKIQLAEKAASIRQEIQMKIAEHQEQLSENDVETRDSLTAEFNQYQEDFINLVQEQESKLKQLVVEETQSLQRRLEDIYVSLGNTATRLGDGLTNNFDNFKKRVDEEASSLLEILQQHRNVLNIDIDRCYEYGIDKLELVKNDFSSSLEHLVNATEVALSRQIRTAQIDFFLPMLREHKQVIENTVNELVQTFTDKSFNQAKVQLEGLDSSLTSAREQLKELVNGCLAKLEQIGRNQQSGLEEIFRSAADVIEDKTESVLKLLKQGEQEILEDEDVYKRLAETYNLDSDPALTQSRQKINYQVEAMKGELRSNLETELDSVCARLENITQEHDARLNAKRLEYVHQVRSACDQGLQRIREAIQNSYNEVQLQREKYME